MGYEKGQSGNLKGRPSGRTAGSQLRKSIEKAMPDILESLIEQAIQGDTAAAKALMDKIIPNLKSQSQAVVIPQKKSLSDQGTSVIKQTLAGNISTDSGNNLMAMLSAQGKLIELNDLMARIEALEAKE